VLNHKFTVKYHTTTNSTI